MAALNGFWIISMCGLWNARLVPKTRQNVFFACVFKYWPGALTDCESPATVTLVGSLTAVMLSETLSCKSDRSFLVWSSDIPTAAIRPFFGHSSCKVERINTRCTASFSVIIPATQAAAHSPRLWPRTAAGCSRQDFRSSAVAYCTANVVNWATELSAILDWSSDAISSSKSDHGCPKTFTKSLTAKMASLKTTSFWISCLPIEYHSRPCPPNMNTNFGSREFISPKERAFPNPQNKKKRQGG